jgi:hypothetical protein
MRVLCGAICLIALFVASSDKEAGASKQLAAPLPYTHFLTDLVVRIHRYAMESLFNATECAAHSATSARVIAAAS